mmetsp:Transcript_14738/g.12554  ORF Transcript_14738/g.12554 Transcript_14738/m.12554 type:complete len:120 (+) Transcript_14738:46-405(+)
MRAASINITFYQDFCQRVFGEAVWPNVTRINEEFGGLDIQSNNTVLINGCEDPWQWASINHDKQGDVTAYYVDCEDCGHCVDLYTPTVNDSLNLTLTRTKIAFEVASWINSDQVSIEYY